MIIEQPLQDIELWEAWIEYDPFHPTHFGTLYIFGEIMTDGQITGPLMKKSAEEDGTLIVRIPVKGSGRCRTSEVLYSEPVTSLDQYRSIAIYAGDELVTTLDEIEVLI